jgi:hypothetical protein
LALLHMTFFHFQGCGKLSSSCASHQSATISTIITTGHCGREHRLKNAKLLHLKTTTFFHIFKNQFSTSQPGRIGALKT